MLVIPPGAVMCSGDLEQLEAFAAGGGRVLAFEPISEVDLGKIDTPPTGADIGPGRSPAEVISELAMGAPERIKRVPIDADWMTFALAAASGDIHLEPKGDHLVVRRSVYESTDFVLIVNASKEEAGASVVFENDRAVQLWDPWSGSVSELGRGRVNVTVAGYGAIVLASARPL